VGIAAGPDGNMWFTENSGNRLADHPGGCCDGVRDRITSGASRTVSSRARMATCGSPRTSATGLAGSPGGVVTEFSTGITSGAGPVGIVAARMATCGSPSTPATGLAGSLRAGVVTEFATGITVLPTRTASPRARMATCVHGVRRHRVGRITPAVWYGVLDRYHRHRRTDLDCGGSGRQHCVHRVRRQPDRGVLRSAARSTPRAYRVRQRGGGAGADRATGTWTGTPAPIYTYQWQDCNSSAPAA